MQSPEDDSRMIDAGEIRGTDFVWWVMCLNWWQGWIPQYLVGDIQEAEPPDASSYSLLFTSRTYHLRMTLVFNARAGGSLKELQVGPVDIVATVTAANSAWGWMGGLAGVKEILKVGRRLSHRKKGANGFGHPQLSPTSCHILTYGGVSNIRAEDATEAFGGDCSTQMLGLTLCAIAHQVIRPTAVEIFMTYLAPGLLRSDIGTTDGLPEALHTQLADKIDLIVNEGDARGLSGRFDRAIAALGLTRAHLNHARYQGWGESRGKWPCEWYLLGGFLKWLGSGAIGQYRTRSAAVARLAACMKEVGYKIANIKFWNGLGVRPTLSGILLVTGGSSETDPLMDEEQDSWTEFIFVSRYYHATTGAMLLNSIQTRCDIPPEVV